MHHNSYEHLWEPLILTIKSPELSINRLNTSGVHIAFHDQFDYKAGASAVTATFTVGLSVHSVASPKLVISKKVQMSQSEHNSFDSNNFFLKLIFSIQKFQDTEKHSLTLHCFNNKIHDYG